MLENVKDFIASKFRDDSTMTELKQSITTNFIDSIENLLRAFAGSMRYYPDMSMFAQEQMKKVLIMIMNRAVFV